MPARRPRSTAAFRALTALTTLSALGACREEDLRVSDVYGTYVLEAPAGSAPSPLHTDTMWFRNRTALDGLPNEGWHKTTSLERRAAAAPGSPPDSLVVFEQWFTFRVEDDEVLVTFACPLTIECLDLPHLRGPLVGDVLVLRPRPEMSSSARTYRRVSRDY